MVPLIVLVTVAAAVFVVRLVLTLHDRQAKRNN
ncbi:hypothetical protein CLV71_106228 [Actinophytocola oryzae]|uniref:Uncharacterized protein n=1 Tax=Actinophytocola oryzae TaxID=502181 RepID=A0A4R7VMN4_9PSEU|nr:hypothetical protein CLV71_106228 [Actinophytocola oryzae]